MQNNTAIDDPVAYSVGLVLAGYLVVVLPCWALGAAWNKLIPSKSINPWILPSLAWLVVGFGCLVSYARGQADIDDPMMITAFLPAALGCPLAALRWRRLDAGQEALGLHRGAPVE
ncbi:MAG: hypothetical protein U0931_31270 [Vulcanimicrobiota bacterium]